MRTFKEAIEGCGNQTRRAAEGGGPVVDAEIAGHYDRTVTVALVNDFVEDAGKVALGDEEIGWVVAHLVQDKEVGTAVIVQ